MIEASRRRLAVFDDDLINDGQFSEVNLRRGLIGYWRLDNGVADSSLSGLTLTNNNGVAFDSAGKVGNAASFVASSSKSLSVAHSAPLAFTTSFTLAFWANPTTLPAGMVACAKDTNTTMLLLASTASLAMRIGGASNSGTFANALAQSTWGHHVWRYDGSQSDNAGRLRYTLNGTARTLTFNGTIPSSITNSSGTFFIGTYSGLSLYWDGLIDEMALYSRPISDSEVSEIYSRGNAGKRIW